MLNPTEAQEQMTLAEWLDIKRLKWCHVPNGGFRNKREAAKFKRIGVKPGVPDILIFSTPPVVPNARGCAIELKRRSGGSTTKHQKQWIADLKELGWIAMVCSGAAEAIKELTDLGF